MPRAFLKIVFMALAGASLNASLAGAGEPQNSLGYAQIGVQVTDLERSVAFYRDVVGLPLMFRAGRMVFFQTGTARLMIEKGEPGRSTTIYFEDDNLEQHKPVLESRGVKFAGPIETVERTADYDLKLLEFFDPDGQPLALMGRVSPQGK